VTRRAATRQAGQTGQTGQGSGASFASAQDVARLAGVSRSAVSRCFTPGASIAPETRARVLEAARVLGYQVNDLARGLLARQSRLVGLIASRPELGFRAHLTAELSRALIRRGSVPVLIDPGHSGFEREAARNILFGHRAEACIVLSGTPPREFVELARQNGQPLILIGRDEAGCDSVRIGNEQAAIAAARQLCRNGAGKLGLIGSRSATPTLTRRERAFREEAARLGAPVVWLRGEEADHAGGFEAGARMLADPRPPRGVFCVNDLMAFGLLDAARQRNLPVPGALEVIGFDDLPEAGWPAYDLTTFRQDPAEVARAAISLLERRQADPAAPPETRHLAAQPVFRGSAPRRGDAPAPAARRPRG